MILSCAVVNSVDQQLVHIADGSFFPPTTAVLAPLFETASNRESRIFHGTVLHTVSPCMHT